MNTLNIDELANDIAWAMPKQLFPKAEPLSVAGLKFPATLHDAICALSDHNETPLELALNACLGNISAVLSFRGFKAVLSSGHTEPPNLYLLTLMRSGTRKSSTFKQAMQFAHQHQKNLNEHQIVALKEYTQKKKSLESNYKGRVSSESFENDLSALGEEPVISRLFIGGDVTPESIPNLLEKNKGFLAIFDSEGDIFKILTGQYNANVPLDIFLKGYELEPASYIRKSQSIFIENANLVLSFAVQPTILERDLLRNADFVDRGLLPRFLVLFPKDRLGFRVHKNVPLDQSKLKKYAEFITTMLGVNIEPPGPIPLEQGAQILWEQFVKDVEPEMRPDRKWAELSAFVSKTSGRVVRLALIFEVLMRFEKNNIQDIKNWKIGVSATKMAIDLATISIQHFEIINSDQKQGRSVEERILKHLKSTRVKKITKRDLENKLGLKERDLNEPLFMLVEHGYLKEVTETNNRSRLFLVNPHLHRQSTNTT